MSHSPELEALSRQDDAAVADKSQKNKQNILKAAFVVMSIVVMYLVFTNSGSKTKTSKNINEEFHTSTFSPPSFVRDGEVTPEAPTDNQLVIIPPPPAEEKPIEDVAEFDVPPPPPLQVIEPVSTVIEPTISEEEEFPSRFRSPMVAFDQSTGANAGGGFGGSSDGAGAPTVSGTDSHSQFLATASAVNNKASIASKINRVDATVTEGTLIPGILETAIVSDLPGQIRAVTAADVYSMDGRRVLIPSGTRLIGEYQSSVMTGQTRVFVVWTRLIRDDGVNIRLNSFGSDGLGRVGLTGNVDKKFRERFGSAILLSIVGAGASYAAGYGDRATGSTNSKSGEELARDTIARTFSEMANEALRDGLQVKPTITVHQGANIHVFVRQDLDFSAFYDDPVTEELKEIQRERRR